MLVFGMFSGEWSLQIQLNQLYGFCVAAGRGADLGVLGVSELLRLFGPNGITGCWDVPTAKEYVKHTVSG